MALCAGCGISFAAQTLRTTDPYNHGPFISEKSETNIRDTLTNLRATLLQLEHQANELQTVLDKIKAQGATITSSIRQHALQLRPIQSLPSELLSQIFLTWAQLDSQAAVIAGSVCKAWRNVALSTSELWSEIVFSPLSIAGRPEIDTERLKLWLDRSKGTPLTLKLDFSRYRVIVPPSCNAVIHTVSQHAVRWRKIYLIIPSASLKEICHAVGSSLESLQTLSISVTDVLQMTDFAAWLAALNAPRLWELTLNWGMPVRSIIGHFKHAYLNSISLLEPISVDQALQLLDSLPNLSRVRINIDEHPFVSSHPRVTYSRLRDVEIHGAPDLIYASVTMPRLHQLILSIDWEWSQDQFMPFITRSAAELEILDINFTGANTLNDNHLAECLATLPSIRHLTVTQFNPGLTDVIFSKLTVHDSDTDSDEHLPAPLLAPKLESLCLHVTHGCSIVAVMTMVESRIRDLQAHLCNLDTIALDFHNLQGGLDVPLLKDWEEQGLQVITWDQQDSRWVPLDSWLDSDMYKKRYVTVQES